MFSSFRIRENKLLREQKKREKKKEGEEMQQLTQLYQGEQRTERASQAKQKKDLMRAHLVGSRQGNRSMEKGHSVTVGAVYRNMLLIETTQEWQRKRNRRLKKSKGNSSFLPKKK